MTSEQRRERFIRITLRGLYRDGKILGGQRDDGRLDIRRPEGPPGVLDPKTAEWNVGDFRGNGLTALLKTLGFEPADVLAGRD